MRILLDARLYGLENAGLGRYAINLISNLAAIDKTNDYGVLLREKYYRSLKLPANWQKILADFGHYTVAEQLQLPGLLRRFNPDLVHFLHFNVPVFYRGKYVVTIHDLLMQQHRGKDATTLPPHLYYSKILAAKLTFRSAVKRGTKIIVPSRAVKNEVMQAYAIPEDRIVPIYEGVDYGRFADASASARKQLGLTPQYFLYVGNAYPHKNLQLVIQAMASLIKQTDNVGLALSCSRGVFTEKLIALITSHSAQDYVKYLGFVADKDLPSLYKNAVAFVYPSLSEGFGLQGLEAMAAGTLVIASDIPVFREIYGKHALYFDPRDSTAVIRVMKQSLTMGQAERKRRIESARIFAKEYSWRKMAEQTLAVYTSSVGS